jgi:beta-lactamase class A
MKKIFQTLLQKKVSGLALSIILLLFGGCTLAWVIDKKNDNHTINKLQENSLQACKLKMYRKPNGTNLTHPLIMNEMVQESECMDNIKSAGQDFINENIKNNLIANASVYFRNLESGECFTINNEVAYNPGSLFKLPVLMTYLKLSETNTQLLNSSITYDVDVNKLPNQTFGVESKVKLGGTYLIKMLLEEMAINSDNNATMLLNSFLDTKTLNKIFTDLEIEIPNMHDMNYAISVKDYSKFLRVLYNSTYLNDANSEYALQILTKSPFKEGITKLLPKGTICAHKFGEFGDANGNVQLHESGIVYVANMPYLVTIMSKGSNAKTLSDFVANLANTMHKSYSVN